MKFLLVYGGTTNEGQIIGSVETTIAHRRLSSKNIEDIKAHLLEQGVENVTILNLIRMRS